MEYTLSWDDLMYQTPYSLLSYILHTWLFCMLFKDNSLSAMLFAWHTWGPSQLVFQWGHTLERQKWLTFIQAGVNECTVWCTCSWAPKVKFCPWVLLWRMEAPFWLSSLLLWSVCWSVWGPKLFSPNPIDLALWLLKQPTDQFHAFLSECLCTVCPHDHGRWSLMHASYPVWQAVDALGSHFLLPTSPISYRETSKHHSWALVDCSQPISKSTWWGGWKSNVSTMESTGRD